MTTCFDGFGAQSHAHATALLLSSKRALDASTLQSVAKLVVIGSQTRLATGRLHDLSVNQATYGVGYDSRTHVSILFYFNILKIRLSSIIVAHLVTTRT